MLIQSQETADSEWARPKADDPSADEEELDGFTEKGEEIKADFAPSAWRRCAASTLTDPYGQVSKRVS